MNKFAIPAIAAVIVIGGVSAYAISKNNDDKMMEKTASSSDNEAAMMAKEKEQEAMAMQKDAGAAYIAYKSEDAAKDLVKTEGKDVVYFFHASWCPDCKAIDKELNKPEQLAKLGKNTVIVKTDYDSQKDLKKKYNITHQTAFVRIDANGSAVKQAVLSSYSDLLSF